ncbi:MAG: hypothetical protein NC205_00715 [Prevotella sp.]|nr:hypothetical protein [Alistipes senegalensis]MCM1357084.1 hypothetical protein [Prevotella sp.]MCM1472594.1 hypothetical protein [Muribaculaceae bacterium]
MTEIETTVLSADYSRAVKLNQHIKVHAELAQQSLYEICKGLKEMRDDKLYKELNYKNFEEYCEKEIGLTYRQAYNFCLIAEKFSEENLKSISCIGTTKLSLLAKLDEPQREEIVQNTDLESVTVKELKNKIKSLEVQISLDNDNMRNLETNYDSLEKRHKELWQEDVKEINKLKEEIQKLENENYAFENQVKELESRPVEVAVEKDMEEIETLLLQLERERKAHQEEITRIKDYKSKDNAILSEIEAYKKVVKNSLHNLFTAILRQKTFSRERLGYSVIEMLDEYTKLFRFEDDQKNI